MLSSRKVLTLLGTGSGSGKSLMASALCGIVHSLGVSVAPFKALSMDTRHWPTVEGGEICQPVAVSAEAAGVEPSWWFNPIVIKPLGQGLPFDNLAVNMPIRCSVLGEILDVENMYELNQKSGQLREVVAEAIERLSKAFDVLIVEGAGSPVDLNVIDHDIANLFVTKITGSPVLLAADGSRSGLFGSLVGTCTLLAGEKVPIMGVALNKVIGDKAYLLPGLDRVETLTNVRVLGLLPYDPEFERLCASIHADRPDGVIMGHSFHTYLEDNFTSHVDLGPILRHLELE